MEVEATLLGILMAVVCNRFSCEFCPELNEVVPSWASGWTAFGVGMMFRMGDLPLPLLRSEQVPLLSSVR